MTVVTTKLVTCNQCGKPVRLEQTATKKEEKEARCTPCRIKVIFK